MRHQYSVIVMICMWPFVVSSQRYDYEWPFGYDKGEAQRFGISVLSFNDGKVSNYYKRGFDSYGLAFNGSFTNDPLTGKLALNTNACEIRDQDFKVISGARYLHGDNFTRNCIESYGYPVYQGTLLLPDLVNPNLTYIMTKDNEISPRSDDRYCRNLLYGSIYKQGDGAYMYSGLKRLNPYFLHNEDMTAIPHRDRQHWWVLQGRNQTNEVEKYLIGSDTIILDHVQEIDIVFRAIDQGIGQNSFSMDGKMYAINSEVGLHLFDFDNSTGILSNYRKIEYPTQDIVAQGCCFSPDGRYVYVNSSEEIYQISTADDHEVIHIANFYEPDEIGWPIGVGMMFLGPDGRIYMSPGSTTHYIHVIHHPDRRGKSCGLQTRAIKALSKVGHHLTNIPQYRYLTGIDTTIQFPFSTVSMDRTHTTVEPISIYPNPSEDGFYIDMSEHTTTNVHYEVRHIGGGLVISGDWRSHEEHYIDATSWAVGLYLVTLRDTDGHTWRAKWMKVE